MELKRASETAVVEELTFEPRSPGETTATAFDKSLEASPTFQPTFHDALTIASEVEIPVVPTATTLPALPRVPTAEDLRIVRELKKLKKARGGKLSAKKLVKKLTKEKDKAERPNWRK